MAGPTPVLACRERTDNRPGIPSIAAEPLRVFVGTKPGSKPAIVAHRDSALKRCPSIEGVSAGEIE